jgi:hypothetical protein
VVESGEMKQSKAHNYLAQFAALVAKLEIFATPGKDTSVLDTLAADLAVI